MKKEKKINLHLNLRKTKKGFEAVYQGPKEKYRNKIFKVKKEEDGTNTLIIDSKEGRKLLNVPNSDLRFVEIKEDKKENIQKSKEEVLSILKEKQTYINGGKSVAAPGWELALEEHAPGAGTQYFKTNINGKEYYMLASARGGRGFLYLNKEDAIKRQNAVSENEILEDSGLGTPEKVKDNSDPNKRVTKTANASKVSEIFNEKFSYKDNKGTSWEKIYPYEGDKSYYMEGAQFYKTNINGKDYYCLKSQGNIGGARGRAGGPGRTTFYLNKEDFMDGRNRKAVTKEDIIKDATTRLKSNK